MNTPSVWSYLSIVGLLGLAAFFSAAEIGFASINELRLKRAAESGHDKLASLAWSVYERFNDALVMILLANNLVNIAASSVATVVVISLLGENVAWVATVVMTLLIITFCEILPKIIAVQTSFKLARLSAIPLKGFMILFFPVVWLIQRILKYTDRVWGSSRDAAAPAMTQDDLETIIDTVEDEGVIDEDRAELLQSALDFDDVLAYEIITPRVDLLAIDVEDSFEEVLEVANGSPYSRLPVYEDTIDNIIGILHLNHFYKELSTGRSGFDIREILMPVNFVHKTMPLDDVLREMKKRKCHMVIVTDEYGGTMGCLTMEDVLEQLVGDIWDETDEVVEEFVETGEDTYEADGDMRIEDFFYNLDIDDRDFDDDNITLGGWAIEMLGDYPKAGDSFEYRNLTVTVKKLQNRRVVRLAIKVWPAPELDEEEDL